jgi:hypothetical protein
LPDVVFPNQKSQMGKFWRFENGKGCYLWSFGIYYIQPFGIYALWPFGNLVAFWYISPVLVYGINKNLATLVHGLENPFKKLPPDDVMIT